MNHFFRWLPFPVKLMIIGFVPMVFLIYLTVLLYNEKNDNVLIINAYLEKVNLSSEITQLRDNLQEERIFSFDYVLRTTPRQNMVLQRPKTDSNINRLLKYKDPSIKKFLIYTNLERLGEIRNKIDSGNINANEVMHFYTTSIYRVNSINTIPSTRNTYLELVYEDLSAEKILSELITYYGIIRSNIYHVLYTKKYVPETLYGTRGVYDVFKTYEKEILIKAKPAVVEKFKKLKSSSTYQTTTSYFDVVFKNFNVDSTYNYDSWWQLSYSGLNELRKMQKDIWKDVNAELNVLSEKEHGERDRTLWLLIIALVFALFTIVYTIHVITKQLTELKKAAQKISRGATNVEINTKSKDVIGDLAKSVSKIDKSNRQLAEAAASIGKGNFNINVNQRSKDDILGNAIIEMRNELQQYSEKMELLVAKRTEELERSNKDLQQFAHVASHDLKEPLRKIITFSSRIESLKSQNLTEEQKNYLDKIQKSARRMNEMVEGVLRYSEVNSFDNFEIIDLNHVINDVIIDLELLIEQKKAEINYNALPAIEGLPTLIYQLFYNLLSNSLKFSKPDVRPVINIKAHKISAADAEDFGITSKDLYQIEVSDNGIGFEQEYAEQIFDSFSRLHSKDQFEGTGLGLSLCRKIVMRHNGLIKAISTNDNGATFIITLPATQK